MRQKESPGENSMQIDYQCLVASEPGNITGRLAIFWKALTWLKSLFKLLRSLCKEFLSIHVTKSSDKLIGSGVPLMIQ
jgi:hypothetical protein